MPSADVSPSVALCVDFGSTFTKALLVDLAGGAVLAAAEHPTTMATDVLDGYDACLAELSAADDRAVGAEVLACSSAGGGLRIAVVGNEELVTAEAGRRVALSSGGTVVQVIAAARQRRTPGISPYADLRHPTRAGRRAADRRHRRRQQRGAAPGHPGPRRRRVARAGRGGRQCRGPARGRRDPGLRRGPARAGRQRRAEDRRAGPRRRPRRDPRDVPRARDRWQAPQRAGRLHRHGAWCHARPRADRGRGAVP